jgi:hypothetical protein
MRSGVRFSWRALAVVAGALLFAFALLVVSYQEAVDSSGLAVQYTLAGLAVVAVGLVGYLVGREGGYSCPGCWRGHG